MHPERGRAQGHVEARELVVRVEFGPGEIMDSIPALLDQSVVFLDPRLAAVDQLTRGPRAKPDA